MFFNRMNKWQKYFAITLLLGFLFKYNYLLFHIFNIPSITGAVLKNLIYIVFIIYFIFPLIAHKKKRFFLLGGFIFYSILIIANIWYNRYFGNYLSDSDMLMGQGVRPFKVLFRQIINWVDLAFIIDIILLIYFHFKEKGRKFKRSFTGLSRRKMGRSFLIFFLIILLLSGQMLITNVILGNYSPGVLYNRSSAAFVNVYGLIPLYFYEFYISRFAQDLETDQTSFSPETEKNVEKEDSGNSKLIEGKPNIIAIQVESLDQKLIDYEYNNKEITPFLNKLKDESLYGSNVYSQHVNGSFDAEYSFLTSLYPVNKNYAFKENDMSRYNSLVSILNDNGYETMAFHGNDESFFHREKAYPELGFDKFYSRKDFSEEEKIMDIEESYLGLNDYDFLNQSLDYLEQAESPFFAFMITVTSHTPFDFYPPDQAKNEFEDIETPVVRDYFQSISFVDKSLEMFFNELKKRDLAEDTLFVIYSDHESEIEKNEYHSGRNFVINKNIKPPEHVPLIIKYPEMDSDILDKTGTLTDITPTILELMGMENEGEEFLGTSLLNNEDNPVLFVHELPQVLYRDQLFLQQAEGPEGFEKVGYIEDREKDVNLPETEREKIINMIDYLREHMVKNRSEIE
ncbi:MAG: LTA synthase family protein [Bacillota bacterium]